MFQKTTAQDLPLWTSNIDNAISGRKHCTSARVKIATTSLKKPQLNVVCQGMAPLLH